MLTNALSSVGNLSLTLIVVHREDLTGVGRYAIAFAIYGFISSLVRAGITESVLGTETGERRLRDAAHEISLIGISLSLVVLIIGLVLGNVYIVATALATHGSLLYDFVKITNMALLRPVVALRQEALWTVLTLAAAASALMGVIGPTVVYAVWAVSCAAIGYWHCLVLKISIIPGWPSDRKETRLSMAYALDEVMGGGAVQLRWYLLAGLYGYDLVGVIRAAAMFFSPITIVSSTGQSLLIPVLTRARPRKADSEIRSALAAAALLVACLSPIAMIVVLLPRSVLEQVLGGSADAVKPLLLPLAIEAILNVLSTVAFAGHRAHRAGKRTVVLYAATFPLRVVAVVVAARYHGADGAAWALVAVAGVSTVTFWWSYGSLLRRRTDPVPEF